MSSDVRDLELAERLEAAVAHVAPDPGDRVRSVRRRGSIRRVTRWSAVAAVLAVFLGSLGWAAFALRGSSRPTALPAIDTSGWRTYDGLKPWVLRYPPGWHLQPYGRAGDCGFLVSNVEHEFRHPNVPNEQTTAWDFQGLPNDLVVIELHTCDIGVVGYPSPAIFPLTVGAMRVVTAPVNERFGAPQPYRFARIWAGAVPYSLAVWFGTKASANDRQAGVSVIGSLQLPIPYAETGLELPPGWHGTSIDANSTLGLFAATQAGAVSSQAVFQGCRARAPCTIKGVDFLRLGPMDAYVQVRAFYPYSPGIPLTPLGPELFHRSGEWLGQPILERELSTNGQFKITYWIGPQAGARVRAQTYQILAGLHLPLASSAP